MEVRNLQSTNLGALGSFQLQVGAAPVQALAGPIRAGGESQARHTCGLRLSESSFLGATHIQAS